MKGPEARQVRIAELRLAVDSEALPALFGLLQRGFQLELQVGVTVNELLREQLAVSADYLRTAISTVILNGRPVDDLDAAVVEHGATVALSGAMPGLMGAVLRSGSILASFRSAISHGEGTAVGRAGSGRVRLKLFNRVMKELAPTFLHRGVLLEPRSLLQFVASWQETGARAPRAEGLAGIRSATLDGRPIPFERLGDTEAFSGADLVCLSVECGR